MRILSTKKLQPNQKQFLLNAGFSVIEADFISIQDKDFTFSNITGNLIFTSQNAVRAVSDHPDVQQIRRNPVFCVGQKTADLLDTLGFTVQESADNAASLAKIITADYALEKFTFFCGNIRREELPEMLKIANVDFNEIEVYQTGLIRNKINAALDAVLFFSPSGVESYLKDNKIDNKMCFCIGTTTAKALETKNIIIANRPSVENVIIQCINYYKGL
ncbi:MAG TPA: uroporphyrinogen-III synthase [Flavobacterium sp.]|nr:uroporphyrinogen-III synthase [Flavobacterium sp.]